jgi:hypothetical protein
LAWYIAASACLQVGRVERVRGEEADADAGADLQRGAADPEREPQLLQQLGGDRLRGRAAVVRQILQQQHELVAAVPREQAHGANTVLQPARDRAQQLVAGRVAERVVDRLEVVQVEVEQRDRRAGAAGAGDRVLEALFEQRTVGEPGQAVVVGEVRQLLLAAVARGHVGGDADHRRPAIVAVAHRRVGDVEDQLADLHQPRDVLAGECPAGRIGDLRHPGVDLEHRAAHDLAGHEAEQLERAALREREDPVDVEREQHHRRGLDDRRHLRLRDPEAGLGAAQLGHVDEHALRVPRPAVGAAPDRLLVEHVHDRAVLGDDAVLEVDRDLLARAAGHLVDHPIAVGGVHDGGPELRVLGPALGREARQRLDLRADVADRDGLVVVADVGDRRDLLDEPAEARLGVLERGLRRFEGRLAARVGAAGAGVAEQGRGRARGHPGT